MTETLSKPPAEKAGPALREEALGSNLSGAQNPGADLPRRQDFYPGAISVQAFGRPSSCPPVQQQKAIWGQWLLSLWTWTIRRYVKQFIRLFVARHT